MKYYYDLHIHSCLSPCGDNDMTPMNIAAMAKLKGLHIIALTDHNSCLNCNPLDEITKETGIIFVPGMELCSSEEVHVVALFPDIATALKFGEKAYRRLPDIRNKPEVFGYQFVMDEGDSICAEESRLLINALNISLSEIERKIIEAGGFCFPSHIDRSSFSILSNLGGILADCKFPVVELKDPSAWGQLTSVYPELNSRAVIINSDAHALSDISERRYYFEAEGIKTSADVIRLLKSL